MNKKDMIKELKKINPFKTYGYGLSKRSKDEITELYNRAVELNLIEE